MRPTISELLSGAAEILCRQVLPGVQDPFAASQIANIATMLEALAGEWGDVVASLVENIAALEALLVAVSRTLADSPVATDRALAEHLVAVADGGHLVGEFRFEPLNERRRQLRGLLMQVVTVINRADSQPKYADIRARLTEYLRRIAD